MEAYRIENLKFAYPKPHRRGISEGNSEPNFSNFALDDINLIIKQGEFVTLCGPSGCGKTTLLRHLKPSASPHGLKSGAIYFEGSPLSELSQHDTAAKIGYVLQSPDNQIVTDKVWHELAFGLEGLGLPQPEIRLRVAEMASFFGIQTWFHKSVTELSGGQKQLLALASVMAMMPSVLILDEPTSQLDPIAAGEFLGIVWKINRELGVTIILTEHRLEEAFPLSSRAIVLENGKIIADGPPSKAGLGLAGKNHGMFLAMPAPMRIWAATKEPADPAPDDCPITIGEGAAWLASQTVSKPVNLNSAPSSQSKTVAIKLNNIWFKYEKNLPDVLKGLSFTANYGEITAMLGGNGTGKTTVLSLIAGLKTAYRGKVFTDAQAYILPQNPQSLFTAKTVREDLQEILKKHMFTKEEKVQKLRKIIKICRLQGLLNSHPYDLSGGEQQRAALAKVLLLEPKILLLDEPTKGLDAEYKQIFAAILQKLASQGASVVLVSHDVEFCAEHTHRCALFFDGGIVTENVPRDFFNGNSFYTTGANRMARKVLPEAVTVGDVVQALGVQPPPVPGDFDIEAEWEAKYEAEVADELLLTPTVTVASRPSKTSKIRKGFQTFFALWLVWASILAAFNFRNLITFISGGHGAVTITREYGSRYIGMILFLAAGITGIIAALTWGRERLIYEPPVKRQKHKLSKRTLAAAAIILLTIPVTIYVGIYFFYDRRFLFISMLIILQTILPFVLIFESRKPQARELVVIAVLCAIAVGGRAAFFMLPQFKPVAALVIIAGVAFGGEAGFLVGAMTAFVSNIFFGQGPWTPMQMFAFGIIGFMAGALFHKGLLNRNPLPLSIFGGFATFFIYGGIMNPATVIMFQPDPVPEMFLMAYLQGIPFDLIHAAATVTFLAVISRPMLEKLDRIKVKYGLIE